MVTDWLPELVRLKDHDGDAKKYLDALHQVFEADFVKSKPRFADKRFALKRYPEYDGKSATFWHIISEGKCESDRVPNMCRCQRIRWPKPMIEAISSDQIAAWKNQRGSNTRILLAPMDYSYVVVLDEREDFVLLWTAYCVEHEHQRKKLRKEREAWEEAVKKC